MMKKDTATTLPVIPPDPALALPSSRSRRERIAWGHLFSEENGRTGRGIRSVWRICAAVCALALAAGIVWMMGGSQGMRDTLRGFLPGGAPAVPPSPTGRPSEEITSSEEPPTEELTHGGESVTDRDTDPAEDCTEAPAEDSGEDAESVTEPLTDAVTDAPTESVETLPFGCVPIVSVDMSDVGAGADHVTVDSGAPYLTPAEKIPFDGEEIPAVLLVHTHPLEGYSNGGAWYDPAAGGLALSPHPNAPDGVVALGVALTRYLREQGITVIHLRVPVEAGETSDALYGRVEAAVSDACSLYPQIWLILDLRRSAELTEAGEILRTAGFYQGDCAQVGISVHGDRPLAEEDLAVALALRRCLWGMETSLSRPVRVRDSEGIAPHLFEIPFLTLELGAAGNTYAEAEALLAPLGSAIARVLSGVF